MTQFWNNAIAKFGSDAGFNAWFTKQVTGEGVAYKHVAEDGKVVHVTIPED